MWGVPSFRGKGGRKTSRKGEHWHVLVPEAKEVTHGQFSASAAVGNVIISQEECVDHNVTYAWMASDYGETEIEIKCFNGTHVSIV